MISVFTPAEFEPQEAIWLNWAYYDFKKEYSVRELQLQIIKEVSPYQKVNVVCRDEESKENFENYLKSSDLQRENIEIFVIPFEEIWIRDNGPTFVLNEKKELGMSHFKFNFWGYMDKNSPASIEESNFTKNISKALNLKFNVETESVSEGGGREVNGIGDILLFEDFEKNRNPLMTILEIEKEYQKTLGVKNFIWLPYCSVFEDSNSKIGDYLVLSGHIDGYARFVSVDTILYQRPPIYPGDDTDELHAKEKFRMLENEKVLKAAISVSGNPFKLIQMPENDILIATVNPDDVHFYKTKETAYRVIFPFPKVEDRSLTKVRQIEVNFLNFLITNKVVIQNSYWEPGLSEKFKEREEESIKILQTVFPDKKIISINSRAVNISGGGIHCITNNQPKIAK